MAKSGVKVRELARELGVTSRVLMDRARAEGLAVQNSITRIEPDQLERVRAWFAPVSDGESEGESGSAPPSLD